MTAVPSSCLRPIFGVIVLAACGFHPGEINTTAPDAPLPDVPPGDICYGKGAITACLPVAPTGAITLPATIDTDTDSACTTYASPDTPGACLIAGASISTTSNVAVSGSRPLILLATTMVSISSATTVDASSHAGGSTGPAADPTSCDAGTAPTMGMSTSGGGQGGSFGGAGGAGAAGATDGTGGAAGATSADTHLRGGCAGATGAGSSPGPGAGGAGGGAIYVIAGETIDVEGAIDASGAGGGAGTTGSSGGGGGGSGGMIGLDAPTITIGNNGMVFANGGGGGQGSGATTAGTPGGEAMMATVAAVGGDQGPTSYGGFGGNGSAGTTADGSPGVAGNNGVGGGGGGGGGGGVIAVVGTPSSLANVSPPPRSS